MSELSFAKRVQNFLDLDIDTKSPTLETGYEVPSTEFDTDSRPESAWDAQWNQMWPSQWNQGTTSISKLGSSVDPKES